MLQRVRTLQLLESPLGLDVAHAGDSIAALFAWMRESPHARWPHLLVTELVPGPGLERELGVLQALRNAGVKVVLLSALQSYLVARKAIGSGMDGIVSKSDSEAVLLDAITRVLEGRTIVTESAEAWIRADPMPRLSTQETRLLELYAAGASIAEAAERLGVKQDTARKYLSRIRLKYRSQGRRAASKLELARLAWQDGLLDAMPLHA